MPKPVVAYWEIRGLAEPIRYLLYYKGVDFVDKRYKLGSGRTDWQKEKFSLGLDFPNLPYYIDDDVKITQSTAILRHLAIKHGLAGSTPDQKLRIAVVEQQLTDLRTKLFKLCYNKDFENVKEAFLKDVPEQFKLLSNFLGDRKFLAGNDVSYVDFMAYDVIDFHRYLVPKLLDEFPNLKKYQQRMASLPELQKYLKSEAYKTWPFCGGMATFAARGPEPQREPL